MARVVGGEEAAFRAIYEAQSGYVHDLALRLSGNRTDAEDLSQEVFVAAWRSLPSLRGESSFRTWLHRIAVRVVWAELKRRDHPLWLDLDEAIHVGWAPPPVEERMDLDRALASGIGIIGAARP